VIDRNSMPIMPGFRIHRTSVPIDNNRAKVPRYIVNQYNCISNSGVEFMRRRLSGRWLHGRDGSAYGWWALKQGCGWIRQYAEFRFQNT